MSTETYSLPSTQPLTDAYVNLTDSRLESLFGYHPGRKGDWELRAKRLAESAGARVDAASVAAVLRDYNSKWNAAPEALAAIDAIAEGAPVIVGGQQAGLWSGPLLVIHKAVSIIGAARHAEQLLGRKVAAVFWIAGEDHDWDEANHAYVLTADQGLRKLAAARPEGARTSVSRTAIDSGTWAELLAELEQALPNSDFKPEILQQLGQITEQAQSLSEMFAGVISCLLGKQGLVIMDADDPQLRKLEAPMFEKLITHNDELEQAYTAAANQVKEHGYPLQVDVTLGSANLFVFQTDKGQERTLLYKQGGSFQSRKGDFSLTEEQLLDIARQQPEQLSNNVLTRPLMQDYLFPVLGTVLGAAEIAYWAITGEAFRKLDMEMPIVLPRISFTLIEGTVAKHMGKYELTLEDVAVRFEERKQQWLAEQDQLAIDEKFAAAKQAFEDLYAPLLDLAASVQPGLAKLGDTNRQKIIEQITFLETRTKDAHEKQYEAAIRQLDRIALSLWPSGKPQERVLNMTAYWNRYGTSWLDKLLEAPFSPLGGHQIIYL
ncbi:bacillithiol biosynthesis cysteine-adding enzyme BshC [Paenibacillus algorifonticola]|uniref:Putative cysteine ligase BshC n=1 Tax=Paenibacillus algorifonticola TaxID=684063 RepID=A0A1I1XRK7_9BACL|nr:bacillithiol biosynthesis cysteine-adding enzyme BshC [Paenibacillus algorifonticola]SFE09881.1 bacillithiol biosynthesis cysteine-adding enzyme BshC [Paenibacillus algorifonticola]